MIPEAGTSSELKAVVMTVCQLPPVPGEVYRIKINPTLLMVLPTEGLDRGLKWRVFSVSAAAVKIYCVSQSRYFNLKESFTIHNWDMAAAKGMVKFIGYDT
jgi:hypothetical protein